MWPHEMFDNKAYGDMWPQAMHGLKATHSFGILLLMKHNSLVNTQI